MNDVERIWREIAGRAPTPADALAVANVEAIVTSSRRRVGTAEHAVALVETLRGAIWEIAEAFGVAVPGENECECDGECPFHVLAREAAEE